MSLVFYRKYRPRLFSEVIGQEITIEVLTRAIKENQLSHAYLFAGPRGTGKTTTARLLAKTLNCQKRKAGSLEPCNECESCLSAENGSNLDVIEIDAASHTGVDDVRELIENIKFPPIKFKYKVYIIDEAHQLSKSAFNALLKTLEEPPSYAVFVLASTEPEKFPPTILSRVQRYDFRRIALEDIIEELKAVAKKEGMIIEDEALRLIAANANGGMRDAESVLGQMAAMFGKEKITLAAIEKIMGALNFSSLSQLSDYILRGNVGEAIKMINALNDSGYDLDELNRSLLEYFRYLLLIKVSPATEKLIDKETTDEEMKVLKTQVQTTTIAKIEAFIKALIEQMSRTKKAGLMTLPLEIAIIDSLNTPGDNK
jgi:DNA polymerase-3 subunit gamma/tau